MAHCPIDSVVQEMLEYMDDLEWVEGLAALAFVQANLINKMIGDSERKLGDAAKLLDLVNDQALSALEGAGWEK